MADEAYERSLVRAIKANGLLRPFARAFAALPDYTSALIACDVVALTGARVDRVGYQNHCSLFATTLALRGYGLEMSRQLREQLIGREPEFSAANCMLMSKQQLLDEYGSALGVVLADTLSDPQSQPILHALLFGEQRYGSRVVQRQAEEVMLETKFILPLDDSDHNGVVPSSLDWRLRQQRKLLASDAQFMFEQVTEGRSLELLSIVPVFLESKGYEGHNEETES
jgi:hypothetical protein